MAKASIHFRGDPWSMFGLISLWFALQGEHPFFCGDPRLDAFKIELAIKTDPESLEQMKEWLRGVLQHRWNELFWRSPAAKIFNRPLTYEDGFVNINESIDLTADMRRAAKEDHNRTLKARGSVVVPRDNFIGVGILSRDVKTLRERIPEVVDHFINQLVKRTGRQTCDICGRQCPKRWDANQYLNPFTSKHHNTRVRDAHRNSSYFKICPECYMISMFATLDRNIPFVRKGNERRIVLPDIKNLKVLEDVYTRLRQNLIDHRQDNSLSIWTNLRAHWADDKYSLTVALLHNILFRFSDSNEGNWSWDPAVPNLDKTSPARWYILPFIREKNVNFGAITSIKPKHDSYRLIEEIPLNDGRTCIPVTDILGCMHPLSNACFSASLLSKAIATSNPDTLAAAVVFIAKEIRKGKRAKLAMVPQKGRPHPVRLLRPFAQHFLEVTTCRS